MRQVLNHPLWLGHIGDARDLRGILAVGILAVVDLAINEPPITVTRELAYLRFPLVDGQGNPPWLLRAAITTVTSLIQSRTPTLVYCAAGLSRTPCIVGAALALVEKRPLREGLALVSQSGPADVSPGLWAEIVDIFSDGPADHLL